MVENFLEELKAKVVDFRGKSTVPDTFERLKAALANRYAIERELGSGGMARVLIISQCNEARVARHYKIEASTTCFATECNR